MMAAPVPYTVTLLVDVPEYGLNKGDMVTRIDEGERGFQVIEFMWSDKGAEPVVRKGILKQSEIRR